jgi:hypothetical protein
MIPLLIHQLWIDPQFPTPDGPCHVEGIPSEPPLDVEENRAAWTRLHSNFDCKLWSLNEVLKLARFHDRDDVCTGILACRFPAMQADVARLFLLEMTGGFWVDLKLFPLVSFLDQLTNHELIVTEHFPKDNLPEPNGFLINSFIGARPHQPCITEALATALRNIDCRMSGSIFYVAGSTLLQTATASMNPVRLKLLPHTQTWGHLFEIRGGSYNANGLHWSQRQERESPYHDSDTT